MVYIYIIYGSWIVLLKVYFEFLHYALKPSYLCKGVERGMILCEDALFCADNEAGALLCDNVVWGVMFCEDDELDVLLCEDVGRRVDELGVLENKYNIIGTPYYISEHYNMEILYVQMYAQSNTSYSEYKYELLLYLVL